MIRLAVFALASIPIVWVSRRSLLHPASHGFPRFFAFESTLALLVLNIPYWFVDPFGLRQLVSWSLLVASVVFVVWGLVLLRRLGGSRPADEASADFEWESTGSLVTKGIYRYIRHPMYSSLLLLAWGALLKLVTPGAILAAIAATGALIATARAEEAENLVRFGDEYRDYMRQTRRFVPFLL
jgi:protein-S-isoprenylcysteine O-methyltransferase Ste14